MDECLFKHSPTIGHLGCFKFLDVPNKAAMNHHVQVFFFFLYGHKFSSLWAKCSGVRLLGYIISICLVFYESAELFPGVVVPFHIPTSSEGEIQYLLVNLVVTVFYFSC